MKNKVSTGLFSKSEGIKNKCKLDICKIYFKKILLYGAEMWGNKKKEDSKIQAKEIKFFERNFGEKKKRQK